MKNHQNQFDTNELTKFFQPVIPAKAGIHAQFSIVGKYGYSAFAEYDDFLVLKSGSSNLAPRHTHMTAHSWLVVRAVNNKIMAFGFAADGFQNGARHQLITL